MPEPGYSGVGARPRERDSWPKILCYLATSLTCLAVGGVIIWLGIKGYGKVKDLLNWREDNLDTLTPSNSTRQKLFEADLLTVVGSAQAAPSQPDATEIRLAALLGHELVSLTGSQTGMALLPVFANASFALTDEEDDSATGTAEFYLARRGTLVSGNFAGSISVRANSIGEPLTLPTGFCPAHEVSFVLPYYARAMGQVFAAVLVIYPSCAFRVAGLGEVEGDFSFDTNHTLPAAVRGPISYDTALFSGPSITGMDHWGDPNP